MNNVESARHPKISCTLYTKEFELDNLNTPHISLDYNLRERERARRESD